MNDRELTVRASENLTDWYCIEWAEHDGTSGLVPTDYGFAFTHAGRVSDADVEGGADEMRAIADAIERGESFEARRCAVRPVGDGFHLWSPRNSQEPETVTRRAALALAAKIREVCPVVAALAEGPKGGG